MCLEEKEEKEEKEETEEKEESEELVAGAGGVGGDVLERPAVHLEGKLLSVGLVR
jgi:hypothetical protein